MDKTRQNKAIELSAYQCLIVSGLAGTAAGLLAAIYYLSTFSKQPSNAASNLLAGSIFGGVAGCALEKGIQELHKFAGSRPASR